MQAKIHQGHQGITRCRERAKQAVWWYDLSRQISSCIRDMVESCSICTKHQPTSQNHCAPRLSRRPWQAIGTDLLCSRPIDYLLVVDYLSYFIKVSTLRKNKTSTEVIRPLKAIFTRHGILEKVKADRLLFHSADYTHFAREWGFQIDPSSTRSP